MREVVFWKARSQHLHIIAADAILSRVYEDTNLPHTRGMEDVVFCLLKDGIVSSTLTLSLFDLHVFPSHPLILKNIIKGYNSVHLVSKFASDIRMCRSDFILLNNALVMYCKERGIDLLLSGVTDKHAAPYVKLCKWDRLTKTLDFPEYGTRGVIIGLKINV